MVSIAEPHPGIDPKREAHGSFAFYQRYNVTLESLD
jgi:deferrochelatase/peroxidase EfeB